MVDYKDIGQRIRAVRLQRNMTQEQLAEAVGVGVTHVSHIETGNSIPSVQVLVDIINTLNCSADELLCINIEKDRPVVCTWINDLLSDCSVDEIQLIADMIAAMKNSLHRHKITGEMGRSSI